MKHVKALGIKFLFISIILYSLLAIFQTASLTEIFIISVSVTALSYLLGDLLILPRFNNVIATIADFGLTFATVWILASMFIYSSTPIGIVSGFSALFISVAEALFHVYMKERVLETVTDDHNKYLHYNRFQTEFSDEEHTDYIEEKDK